MKHVLFRLLAAGISLVPMAVFAQPGIQWQRCYGGTKQDIPSSIIETSDGGYIMVGSTSSDDSDITSSHGGYDVWVVKLSADGTIAWQKTYGGSGDDYGGAILPLSNGYLICSSTLSDDGDLQQAGHHGKTSTADIWIFEIDSIGTIRSQKIFGGSGDDYFAGIAEAGEGEYLVAANTNSSDGDVHGYHGGTDIWLFTFTLTGTIPWQHVYGGSRDDEAGSLIKTSDGNYLIAGYTTSSDGDVKSKRFDSSFDEWLFKINPLGNIIWQKTYGGSGADFAYSANETLDHGYITVGLTSSKDGDVSGLHGLYGDAWIVKTDAIGNIEWQKCYGGSMGDAAFTIYQNADSSYLVAGYTASDDGDVSGLHGNTAAVDCWIVKISKTGKLLWQKTLGGSATEATQGVLIMPASDSGLLVLTETQSIDGDITNRKGGSNDWDFWLVKLFPEKASVNSVSISNKNILLYPDPAISKTTITYFLDKLSEIKIELYNPLGEKLRTLIDAKEEAGSHEHEFDLSTLASGSYYVRIYFEGKWLSKVIELIH